MACGSVDDGKSSLLARLAAGDIPFLEVFVDAPLATCEERDPKGFYRKARQNLIPTSPGFARLMKRLEILIFGSTRAFFQLKNPSRASSRLYWQLKRKAAKRSGRHAFGRFIWIGPTAT